MVGLGREIQPVSSSAKNKGVRGQKKEGGLSFHLLAREVLEEGSCLDRFLERRMKEGVYPQIPGEREYSAAQRGERGRGERESSSW